MSNCCSDDPASKQERGATPSVAGAKSIATLAAAHLAGKGTQEQTRGGSHKHKPKNTRPEAGRRHMEHPEFCQDTKGLGMGLFPLPVCVWGGARHH